MKISLLTVLLLPLAILQANAQPAYHYNVEKVTEDIYVLEPNISEYRWVTSNITVIINLADVLVVDSGLLPEAATEAIREIRKLTSKPVRYLLNTHWHGDHWQGNEVFVKEFPGLAIIAAEAGRKGMMRNGMMWINTFYPKHLQEMISEYEADLKRGSPAGGKPFTESQKKDLVQGILEVRQDLESVKKIHAITPTLTFTDQLTIRSGDREFQFYYLGIGNTVGDAVLYLPKEKILIPGDLVVSPSPYESGAFSKEWVSTSKKLKQYDFNFLIPGHGTVQKNDDYLDYLNALFAEVVKQINSAYLSGKPSPEEAAKVVTTENIVRELSKTPRFVDFAKQLDPAFVPAAVRDSFRQVVIGGSEK